MYPLRAETRCAGRPAPALASAAAGLRLATFFALPRIGGARDPRPRARNARTCDVAGFPRRRCRRLNSVKTSRPPLGAPTMMLGETAARDAELSPPDRPSAASALPSRRRISANRRIARADPLRQNEVLRNRLDPPRRKVGTPIGAGTRIRGAISGNANYGLVAARDGNSVRKASRARTPGVPGSLPSSWISRTKRSLASPFTAHPTYQP